jgi:hypothetical protein
MKHILKLSPLFMLLVWAGCNSTSESTVSPGSGTGGSMARFTISKDFLYIITNTTLKPYDILNSSNPIAGKAIFLTNMSNNVAETIFPYGENLFIGTQRGMYIYNLANPFQPQYKSFYRHFVSCDPVVVQGKYAYVTLRSGTACGNNATNVLDVVDVTDLANPKVLKSYPMFNPHGLGVDGNLLFVCEGEGGLKVFDNTNPLDLKLIQEIKDVRTYDVIPKDKVLIVTGKDGIFQYSYQNPKSLKALSSIKVG